jgi:hypothetical protein
MTQKKTRVICSVRCSHCNEFGRFENYTKADGHFRGVFLCEDCREKGVPFPGEESKEPKKEKKKAKKVEKKKVKELENTGITSLLLGSPNKKAKKPTS